MNKEWKCKDCVVFGTDACHYPSQLAEYKACEHLVVDHEKSYQQGGADRETEIIRIIENLKESAESQMMDKCVYACDRILEEIKLNEKS